jgi:hypothetical protein
VLEQAVASLPVCSNTIDSKIIKVSCIGRLRETS